eukprot:Polyplicarium_translucidae@DN1941_c0_g1_i2.p2
MMSVPVEKLTAEGKLAIGLVALCSSSLVAHDVNPLTCPLHQVFLSLDHAKAFARVFGDVLWIPSLFRCSVADAIKKGTATIADGLSVLGADEADSRPHSTPHTTPNQIIGAFQGFATRYFAELSSLIEVRSGI